MRTRTTDEATGADNWTRRALCWLNPDMWFDKSRTREAVHQCLVHCPVLWPCRAEAIESQPPDGVMGGFVWVPKRNGYMSGRPGTNRSRPVSCKACEATVRHACGYCGESTVDINEFSPPLFHPECEADYRKSMAEATSEE